ncbi:hypothetical protein FQZ97_965330 [compost metagenome]
MILHCLFVPARQPEPVQIELNTFLAAQRVLAVQREWLADGAQSGGAFCAEMLTKPGVLPGALKAPLSGDQNCKSLGVQVRGSGRRALTGCLVGWWRHV